MSIKRREFLRGLGMTGAAAFLPVLDRRVRAQEDRGELPDPLGSGIEYVVVVMMENRSFDHVLGWLPGSDGRQRGLRYADPAGIVRRTYPLVPDYTGCGHPDPDHSYEGGRIQYAGGAMDGFLKSGNDVYGIGFYTEDDRPFANTLARHYLTLDRSFCSILGPTFPNRLFLHAAQTDRLSNTFAHADIRRGDAFLAQAFHAVANGPGWPSTVFIVTYDEWGGFFDHVAPPRATAPNTVDQDLVAGKAPLGFRVPTIVASPWTRGDANAPSIDSGVADHTSILKLIEWRWGWPPLTARDASADVQSLPSAA